MASHGILCCTHLVTLLLVLVVKHRVEATEYTVGDEEGWTYSLNYLRWAQKYNFTVRDVLVFNYVKGQHNVYQVLEATYRSCDSTSGVLQTYASGDDHVTLTMATDYYFICNIKGHCLGGMKLGITVVRSSPSRGGSGEIALPPPPPLLPPPPPPNGVATRGIGLWSWWRYCLVMLGLFPVLN